MPKASLPSINHHIARIDTERNGTHARLVRMQHRSLFVNRYFSDGKFGGKVAALKAARAFRDVTLSGLEEPFKSRWRATELRRNNVSGMPGVARYVRLSEAREGGEARPYWVAFWANAEGRRGSMKFLVAKYGEAGARRGALAVRQRALADKYGTVK